MELFDILNDPNEQKNLYVDSIDPKLVENIKQLIMKRKKLGLGKTSRTHARNGGEFIEDLMLGKKKINSP